MTDWKAELKELGIPQVRLSEDSGFNTASVSRQLNGLTPMRSKLVGVAKRLIRQRIGEAVRIGEEMLKETI